MLAERDVIFSHLQSIFEQSCQRGLVLANQRYWCKHLHPDVVGRLQFIITFVFGFGFFSDKYSTVFTMT